MPDNLFEQDNEFRLVDVDGVFLASPNDYIVIRDPVGFKETMIVLNRGKKSHGFNYEFTEEEKEFGFHRIKATGETYSGYEVCLGIFEAAGVDGNCNLEYYENSTLVYTGNVDYHEHKKQDYIINVKVKRISFDDLFRTRYETPVSMDATTTIDGASITPPTAESMFMHSKALIFSQYARSNNSTDNFEFFTDNDDHIMVMDYFTEKTYQIPDGFVALSGFKNEIEMNFGRGASSFLFETTNIYEVPSHYRSINGSFGLLTIDYDAHYILALTNFGSVTITHTGTYIRIIGENFDTTTEIYSGTTYSDASSLTVCEVEYTYSGEFYIPKNANVYIYDLWNIPTNTGVTQTWSVNPDPYDHLMDMTFEVYNDNSFCDVYDPSSVFNHALRVITGQASALESSFFSSDAPDIYLTDGYKIRNFPSRDMYVNFKDLFEGWAQPMFGLGYQIYNDSGTLKLLMERYSNFYQNVEIDYIDSIIDNTFNVYIDDDVHFNEVVTGYKEYPKSTDENTSNNIDEFNTKHFHITPLKKVKNKAEYLSEIIGSGYKIENQRREQFKDVPSDTVTDDDNIFCVKGIDSASYTGVNASFAIASGPLYFIDIEGKFFNLSVGDVITFTNTVSNNSSFTIEDVSEYLIGNTYFQNGYRLQVTESVTTEHDTSCTMSKSAAFLRAERDEAFDTLANVLSPETVYNAGLNPKNMLLNQSPIFLSGLNKKSSSLTVKSQRVFLNDTMNFQFSTGEGDYVLGAGTAISMQGSLTLSAINSNTKLFSGEMVNFKCKLSYTRIKTIRSACLNEHGSKDFGFVRVKDDLGVDWKVFIMEMRYNPLSEEVEITGRVKYEA